MSDFPGNLASDGSLLIAANNVSSTLNGGLSAVAVSATMASTVHFPVKGGITVESEAILYTGNDTATSVLSGLTRGADSTTAVIHADGTAVFVHMQARHHNALKDEVIAIETNIASRFGNTTTGVSVNQVFSGSATFNGTMTSNTTTVFNGITKFQTSTTFSATTIFQGDATFNTATAIKGTITNDNAAAGFIGEYTESVVSVAQNATTTAEWGDLTSLTLTSGDWNLVGFINFTRNTGTWSAIRTGIGTEPGNTSGSMVSGSDRAFSGWSSTASNVEGDAHTIFRRFLTTTASIVYLKYQVTYTAGNPQVQGALKCRRAR
jgi:hypothetical protein